MPFSLSQTKCPMSPCPCTAAHRWFVMAGTTTTTTTLPQAISIRQPPTCLNVVDPSDHPDNLLSHNHPLSPSRYYRELISTVPPLAFQRPDRRLTSLSHNFSYTSSNYLNTLLSIHHAPPPLLKTFPPSSRVRFIYSGAGISSL